MTIFIYLFTIYKNNIHFFLLLLLGYQTLQIALVWFGYLWRKLDLLSELSINRFKQSLRQLAPQFFYLQFIRSVLLILILDLRSQSIQFILQLFDQLILLRNLHPQFRLFTLLLSLSLSQLFLERLQILQIILHRLWLLLFFLLRVFYNFLFVFY